jgi:hypothetical protein
MEITIAKGSRNTFLAHAIVSTILGLVLFVIPGRMLLWLGYIPDQWEVTVGSTVTSLPGTMLVDPVITRVLGAALLALAYASYLGWRAKQRQEISILVLFEFVFCALALLGILVRIVTLGLAMPVVVWVIIVILLGFLIAFGLMLRR